MTDGPVFQISSEALQDYGGHGDLMAQVSENIIENLVQRDNEEMSRIFSGTWEPPIVNDSLGLFQQGTASFHDNEVPDQDAVKKQLQEKFANKLGTRTPESVEIMARAFPVGRNEETVVVPRKNGKKTTQKAAQDALNSGASIAAVAAMGSSGSHSHGMPGPGAMQGKTQVAGLNIFGRDVEECTQCGALVLDTAKHKAEHKADQGEMNALLRQLADARGEIRALKEAKTKRVPRPKKKTMRDELRDLQAEARAAGALTPQEQLKNMSTTYEEAVDRGIMQQRGFVDIPVEDDPKLPPFQGSL